MKTDRWRKNDSEQRGQGGSSYQNATTEAQTWTDSSRNITLNRKSGSMPCFQGQGALPPLSTDKNSHSTEPMDSAGKGATYILYGTQFHHIMASVDITLTALTTWPHPADLAHSSMMEEQPSHTHQSRLYEWSLQEPLDLSRFFARSNRMTLWLTSVLWLGQQWPLPNCKPQLCH